MSSRTAEMPASGVAKRKSTRKSESLDASQADMLLQLVTSTVTLLRDDAGTVYIEVEGKRRELLRLESDPCKSWLAHRYQRTMGKVVGGNAIRDATRVLVGMANDQLPVPVWVRTAATDGKLYLDLANPTGEVVEISKDGWSISTATGIRFLRPKGMRPLPTPVSGGDLRALQPLLNVTEGQFVLAIGWLLGALMGRGPFPLLVLFAEQGSAKTTLMRLLRSLVDPNASPVRAPPREERELAISASNAHVLSYDNLSTSGCSAWLSDALCRVATGGGIAPRKLYSDGDEALLNYIKPVMLSSIDEIAERPDLGDRSITLNLHPIAPEARMTEAAVLSAFECIAPGCLGKLLDAACCALANLESTHIDTPPRMADFATFVTAAEPALGWSTGTFLRAYRENVQLASQAALEADPITAAIRALLDKTPLWSGTPTALLDALTFRASEELKRSNRWPRAPNQLTNRLRRVTPALRAAGINISDTRNATARQIELRRSQPPPEEVAP